MSAEVSLNLTFRLKEFDCMQVSDGASAVLLMTRREALKRSLPILGIFR